GRLGRRCAAGAAQAGPGREDAGEHEGEGSAGAHAVAALARVGARAAAGEERALLRGALLGGRHQAQRLDAVQSPLGLSGTAARVAQPSARVMARAHAVASLSWGW